VMLIGMKVAEEKVEKVKKVAAQPERAARLDDLSCAAHGGRESIDVGTQLRLRCDVHRNRVLEAVQDLVGRVLQARVRLVQLARRLAGELAELIAVGHVRESTKDQIGTHS
jgi:hypothetical protein